MLRTWLEPEEITLPDEFSHSIGGNPMVSKVLFSRGIRDVETARGFLLPNEYHPSPASEIPGVAAVAGYLQEAITQDILIGVWGDFDVDGQTATTLLVSALRQAGARVVYHIPVRSTESHGISLSALQGFLHQGVQVILTCDTGISSHEAIDYAQTCGVPVLLTDHHDLPEELPKAKAIANPKMLPINHPLSSLPGVGLAYKVVEHLYQILGLDGAERQFLDLVALGIVADIAMLRGDTRYLLQLGLDAIHSTKRPGLLSMMEFAEINQANLTEEHISYILAPRMNAIGRLDDANQMVELLTTVDIARARILALELEGLNAQRKLLTDQVYRAAEAMLTQDPHFLDLPILVLSHPAWPAGVVGIVASRLVEQYHRPVILLSSPAGEDARGSARSIEAVNITSAIAANHALVKGFGGHPMAAGLVLDPENIDKFRQSISQTIQAMGVELQAEESLPIDGYLTLPELSLDLVEDFERLAPFGAGNPPLILATRNLKLTGYAAVGRNDEHLQLTIEDELGHLQRSIWWQGAGNPLPEGNFDLAYSVRASTYRGQRDVQVEWVDYRLAESQKISLSAEMPALEVVDLRSDVDPVGRLIKIQAIEEVTIWGEANPIASVSCLDRNAILPAKSLVIWTIPPGLQELQAVLHKVNPTRIFLFAVNPGMDEPEPFLTRLLGLLKYRIQSARGVTNLSALAAATAQRTLLMKTALEWLKAHGKVSIISLELDQIQVEVGSGTSYLDTKAIDAALDYALAESAAFRRYYLKVDKERLVVYE